MIIRLAIKHVFIGPKIYNDNTGKTKDKGKTRRSVRDRLRDRNVQDCKSLGNVDFKKSHKVSSHTSPPTCQG